MIRYIGIVLAGALVALAGCSDDTTNGTGGVGGTGATGGTGGTGGTPTFADPCADQGGSGQVDVASEEISEDTIWRSACTYLLAADTIVYVVNDTTLEIEPGTTVLGSNGSALVITQEATIEAPGTAAEPIIFTSSRAEGSRTPGDWGGVVLLGSARLSWGNEECDGEQGQCTANIEGLPAQENRGTFGGNDDSDDCGTITYARIEFAGFTIGMDNELNSLSVGGCGSATTLDYIQVHRGLDDGFEFFGGTANLSHGICTGTGDDCFDTDQGYRGTIDQFIAHHFAGSSNDPRGIESDNFSNNNDVQPRSAPIFTNGTVVATTGTSTDQGIVARRGTYATYDGVAVAYYADRGFDMRDASWETGWDGTEDGAFVVKNSCFAENSPNWPPLGTDCEDEMAASGDCNDPEGVVAEDTFDEATELASAALSNQEGSDAESLLGLTQAAIAPATTGGTPDYALSAQATEDCSGAFSGGSDWTTGWTAYPVD